MDFGPLIRPAKREDAPAIATVHIRSWREAYRGLVPSEVLRGLSVEERADMWERALRGPPMTARTLVAEDRGEVIGFLAAGATRDEDLDSERVAGIYALYLDPDHWGRGVGRALMERALREMALMGFQRAVLWVLITNERARGFLEAVGWAPDGVTRTREWGAATLEETRYEVELPGRAPPAEKA